MEERTKLEPALDELLVGKSAEEIAGPGGLLKQLTKALLERAMNAELTLPPDSDGVHPHKNHRRSALKRDFQEAAGRGGPGGIIRSAARSADPDIARLTLEEPHGLVCFEKLGNV